MKYINYVNFLVFAILVSGCEEDEGNAEQSLSVNDVMSELNLILQPYYGDSIESAEGAIRKYIDYIEENRSRTEFKKLINCEYDLMNGYARLALLQKRKGEPDAARESLDLAIQHSNALKPSFPGVVWIDLSDEEKEAKLVYLVESLDEGAEIGWKTTAEGVKRYYSRRGQT